MKRLESTRSSLFLMEIIVAIGILSVVGALCLQIFAYSHTINETSSNQTQAALKAQDIASLWQSQNNNEKIKQYYDKNWEPCNENQYEFYLEATPDDETLNINIYQKEESIYHLYVEKHIPIME